MSRISLIIDLYIILEHKAKNNKSLTFLGVSWFLITLHAAFYNIDAVLCPGEEELNALVQVV